MKDLTGLFVVVVLVFLSGGTVETVPDSGYCIVNQCFTVGGHLMTVRSSVSHDVLYILLGNFTGQFWIGLHLLTGCPDAAAGLKGFQWVTKDNESDFFNWAPGFDSSCSSHRCVSVSKESDFKWTQEPCGEQGFQCVCKEGYSLSGSLCVDQDECASAPCEHMCDNTPGMRCAVRGAFCIDIDECSFFYCDQGCVNTFGSYVCSCNPGFTLVGEYRCVKDDKGTVTDGGMGGKTAATTPDIPTTPSIPPPDPTRQPSGVTVGGLVGIIVCTVFFIVLIVFLAHHFLNRGGKMESAGALKAHEDEGHSLHRVTSDTS
uniref:Thrombomodulin n=1 Tax=Lates calcarifer TaxID=8187 RepID=A0A4W6CZT0_LATCA